MEVPSWRDKAAGVLDEVIIEFREEIGDDWQITSADRERLQAMLDSLLAQATGSVDILIVNNGLGKILDAYFQWVDSLGDEHLEDILRRAGVVKEDEIEGAS